MQLLSKVSNILQNTFSLYDITGFTQIRRLIHVATKCKVLPIRNTFYGELYEYDSKPPSKFFKN